MKSNRPCNSATLVNLIFDLIIDFQNKRFLEGKSPSVKLMISVRTMQKSDHVFEVGFGQFFIFSARHQLDTWTLALHETRGMA